MSQSPAVESELLSQATDPDSPFRQQLKEVNRLISASGTLSGHERNCLFLNTGTERFATISAVSGFDFDDDTRAVATVDWDGDGDLDVWTTNRTSPRVRVLRNDRPNENHFVAFKLEGTRCNRDAIGARVEVFFDSPSASQARIVKTLRAGEGFLTQCSKWLHFGLGTHDLVRKITVDWPGGEQETFAGFSVDRRYRCVEGTGEARPVARRHVTSLKKTIELGPSSPSGQARIPLTHKIPVPLLRYEDAAGQPRTVDTAAPTLIILWASQCAACREELNALVSHRQQLLDRKLRVVAFCVDSLVVSSPPPHVAVSFLESIRFPFESGVATEELIKRLQTIYDMPFAVPVEMATPTSFLLDENARLAVIYRGKANLAELLQDVDQIRTTDDVWMRYSVPFSGRWNVEPTQETKLLRIPLELVDRGYLNDAIDYLANNYDALTQEAEFAKLAVWIGDQLIAKRRTAEALTHYQLALASDPTDVTVMNNVAWQFATHRDERIRNGEQAVRWAEQAAKQTNFAIPGVLDTLAASYAAANQFPKAINAIERAILIAKRQRRAKLVQKYTVRLDLYKTGRVLLQDQ